jgi:hypothetical protein
MANPTKYQPPEVLSFGQAWENEKAAMALLLPILAPGGMEPVRSDGRSRRERAREMQERMGKFSAIYNAGWFVRDSYFGADARQHDAVMRLVAVLLQELRTTQDRVACMYALVDALSCGKHGLPWEAS